MLVAAARRFETFWFLLLLLGGISSGYLLTRHQISHRPGFHRQILLKAFDDPRSPRNRARNVAAMEHVRNLTQTSAMIIALNLTYVTAAQEFELRHSLPENVTTKVIRRRLMLRAINDTDFEDLDSILTGQNMYIFTPDNDMVPTLRALRKFIYNNPPLIRKYPIKAYSTPQRFFSLDNTSYVHRLRTREECIVHMKRLFQRPMISLLKLLTAVANQTQANQTQAGLIEATQAVELTPVNITSAQNTTGVQMAESSSLSGNTSWG